MVFYASVGQSISAWAHMETGLIYMFASLMGTHPQKAGLVLYSINNFHSWLSLIETLMASDDRLKHLVPVWNKKSEVLKKLNDTRARIAHQRASDDTNQSLGKVLAASRLDTRVKTLKQKPLTVGEIHSFIQSTLKISADIADFLGPLTAVTGRPPSPATPTPQEAPEQTDSR